MNDKKVIFYSWQSDTDKKTNNYFIKDALEKALKKLNKETESELTYDSDTRGESGSVNITDTIFRKIHNSNIFLCDVTSVGSINNNSKKVSNSNVMIELGYAIKSLGWKRIICINNLFYGKIEELPFDIRQHRISAFSLSTDANQEQKKKEKENLSILIYVAIKSVLDNYDNILLETKKDDYIQHDKEIFKKIDAIFSENDMHQLIYEVVEQRGIYQSQYNKCMEIFRFRENKGNLFIDEILVKEFLNFVESLENLYFKISQYSFRDEEHNKYVDRKEYRYTRRVEIPFGWKGTTEEFYKQIDMENQILKELCNIMKKNYQEFRILVKETLVI